MTRRGRELPAQTRRIADPLGLMEPRTLRVRITLGGIPHPNLGFWPSGAANETVQTRPPKSEQLRNA